MMDINNQNLYFYYKIGKVETTTRWDRPNFDRVKKFLNDIKIKNIISLYPGSYIYGALLWKKIKTWDVDLGLNINDLEFDPAELENHINILNNISLNKFGLLLDITARYKIYQLPLKEDIIVQKKEEDDLFFFSEKKDSPIIKISYYEKECFSEKFIIDYCSSKESTISHEFHNKNYMVEKVTNRYLVKITQLVEVSHPEKVIKRVYNAEKKTLLSYIDVKEFLSLSEIDFINIQNF
jgi:hypothetical protein